MLILAQMLHQKQYDTLDTDDDNDGYLDVDDAFTTDAEI